MPLDYALSMILYLLVLQTLLKTVDAKIQVLTYEGSSLCIVLKHAFLLKSLVW